jgi:cobalt/nickel transport system permease protein
MRSFHSSVLDIGELDALARRGSVVHGLDPRAKLATTILFLVAVVSWNRYEVFGLLPLAAYPLFLCAAGRVPFAWIAKRLLVAAPFALALGAFNPIFDTGTRAVVGGVAISGGWLSFASIALRLALTVAAALALVAVTGMNPLCAAARRLGAPKALVGQVALLYRYLFVLAGESARMSRAAELRAPGRRRSLRQFGSMLGHLLLRALDRGRRIHLAMRCRGFTGAFPELVPTRFGPGDVAFVASWAAFFAGVRFLDLAGRVGASALGALR